MIKSRIQYLNLRFMGLAVKVGVKQPHDIVWLKEFLHPQFEVTDADGFDCEILLDINDDYFSDLKTKRRGAKGEVNGFILDTKIVKLACWQARRDRWLFFDNELNVFYSVASDRKTVIIIAHSRESIGYRTALMRVIREYAENHARRFPGCMMHGGAFSYEGKGVVIAGVKNAGKTSTLTYFLHHLPVKYITNDRLYIRMDAGSPSIHGIPTIFTISTQTLSMFPDINRTFSGYYFHHRYTINEIKQRNGKAYVPEKGDYTLSPGQYRTLLDLECAADEKLSAILLPRISRADGAMALRLLDKEEAVERLKDTELSRDFRDERSLFDIDSRRVNETRAKITFEECVDRLAAEIPCFDCSLGLQAFQGSHAREIFETVMTPNAGAAL